MKKNKIKLLLGLIALSLFGIAQNGMDYVGPGGARYSKLRATFLPAQQAIDNEKAL